MVAVYFLIIDSERAWQTLGAQVCVNATCHDTCNSGRECRGFEACVDGVCLPAADAGQVGSDAASSDAAMLDTSILDHATGEADSSDLARADQAVVDVPTGDAAVDGGPFVFRDIDNQKRRVSEILVLDWQVPALVLATGSGLFYTEDEGVNCTELGLGLTAPWVSSLALRGDGSLLVGTEAGVFASLPGDLSTFAAWGLDGCDIVDLAVAGDTVYAACGQAVYARDLQQDQWIELPGMQGIWVESLAVDGRTRLLVGTDGEGLFEMGL